MILTHRKAVSILFAVVVFSTLAFAEGLDGPPPKPGEAEGQVTSPKAPPPTQARVHNWPETQWKLVWGILAFSVALFLLLFLSWKSKDQWTQIQFKTYVLTLVLTVGLVLVIVGFSDTQIAPLMGILGTIVGYLFGVEVKPAVPPTPATTI